MTREQFVTYARSSQEALRRFLIGLCCGDTALADDIAQETYIKAYLAADTFRDPACFSAWIYRIAYNTFVSSRRASRTMVGIDTLADSRAEERADDSFRYQELYAALDRLSEKERTSILLYYMEGRQINEIAQIIDSTTDAVKQQLSRGRSHLRTILKTTSL